MRWRSLLFILAWATTAAARQGVVQTRDGRILEGNIRLAEGRVIIANAEQLQLDSVSASNVLFASFEGEGPAGFTAAETSPAIAGWPEDWQRTDLGGQRGSSRCDADLFRLTSPPGDRGTHFVYKRLHGQGEILARVIRVTGSSTEAQAGLMIRQDFEPESPSVLLAVRSGHAGTLRWREDTGGAERTKDAPNLGMPHWIRLKRSGDTFSAFQSRGGSRWRLIDRIRLPMSEEVYLGIAVVGGPAIARPVHHGPTVSTALIDQVRVGSSLPISSFVPRVRLRSGSVVAGRMESASGRSVEFPGPLPKSPIALADVASFHFQWLPSGFRTRVDSGRAGVFLLNGEFFESDFRGIDAGRLKMSSVLFGTRTYDSNNEVMAVVVGRSATVAAPFEVETDEGSLFLATSLELGDNEVILHEPLLGRVRVPIYLLREIRRRS